MKTAFRIFLLCSLAAFVVGAPIYYNWQNASDPFIEAAPQLEPVTQERIAGDIVGVGNSFPVAGQEPVPTPAAALVIQAPDIIQVGELVRLTAIDSTVDGILWQILPFTDDFEVIDNGRRAFLTARPDSPDQFLLIVAGAKEGVPYLKHHEIVVDKSNINIDPGTMSLTAKVRGWLAQVEDYERKGDKARTIANIFRKYANDETIDPDGIIASTAADNAAALGDDIERWIPFLKPLGDEMDIYIDNGVLETREQFRDMWILIASTIDRVYPPLAEDVEAEIAE